VREAVNLALGCRRDPHDFFARDNGLDLSFLVYVAMCSGGKPASRRPRGNNSDKSCDCRGVRTGLRARRRRGMKTPEEAWRSAINGGKAAIMRHNALRLISVILAAIILASCSPGTPTSIAPEGSVPARLPRAALIATHSQQLVYVTDTTSVSAYPATSDGSVTPVVVLSDPMLPNAIWDPWGAVFDKSGYLYVQSFLSEATSFVYAPGARTGAKPVRVFMGGGPDTRSIGVDPAGYEYIATSEDGTEIDVLRPRANGHPSNSYYVKPLRAIFTDGTWSPWPDILTTDAKDEVIGGIARYNGNAIEVFEGGRAGSTKPIREIAGSKAGLGTCSQGCQNLSVTFSALTGLIYAGVSTGPQAHISVFTDTANGNVAPLRTIQGTNTGLTGMGISGIAVSDRTGEIYAMATTGSSVSGRIYVYARNANGNIRPVRSFTDQNTGFASAQGIGISR
jgi:hypothetical protein